MLELKGERLKNTLEEERISGNKKLSQEIKMGMNQLGVSMHGWYRKHRWMWDW